MPRAHWRSPCCACCGSAPDRDPETGCIGDERPHLARPGDADRVRQQQRVRRGVGDALGDPEDVGGIHRAFERAAERHAQRDGRAQAVVARAGDDAARGLDRFVDGGTLVALVERLRDAEREAHLAEPRLDETLVPALVECEARVDDAVGRRERCRDLVGSGHLRHPARVDEARHLHGPNPRGDQTPNELDPRLRLEHLGLVLKPVARTHVVERDARLRGHRATLQPPL